MWVMASELNELEFVMVIDRDRGWMSGALPAFHLLAKSTGAVCNLGCC